MFGDVFCRRYHGGGRRETNTRPGGIVYKREKIGKNKQGQIELIIDRAPSTVARVLNTAGMMSMRRDSGEEVLDVSGGLPLPRTFE